MKKIVALITTVALFATPVAYAHTSLEFSIGSQSYSQRDGEVTVKQLDTTPYVTDSWRTMVPLRAIGEAFGAKVDWEEDTQTAVVELNGNVIRMPQDSTEATYNGELKQLDAPATLQNDRIMVPLRFCAELLGNQVFYFEGAERVLVTDKPEIMKVGDIGVGFDEFEMYYDLEYQARKDTMPNEENGATAVEIADAKEQLKKGIIAAFRQQLAFYDLSNQLGLAQSAKEADWGDQIRSVAQGYDEMGLLGGALATLAWRHNVAQSFPQQMYQQIGGGVIVEDAQKTYQGEYVSAKHILIPTQDLTTKQEYNEKEQADALTLAKLLLVRIKNGDDFDKLMNQYSKDTGLATNPNGYVFTKGQMVTEFETTAFALKEGEVSDLVKSQYGYHIIKRQPLPEMDTETQTMVVEGIAQKETNAFLNDVMENYPVTIDEEALALVQ